MKKRLIIAVLVLLMLAVFGHAASANAPVPDPFAFWLDYRNLPEGATLTVVSADGETLSSYTAGSDQGRLTVLDPTEADFFVILTLKDGTTVQSNTVSFASRSYVRFDGATGTLEAGSYLKKEGSVLTGVVLGVIAAWLLLALCVTIGVELLTGLCFRIRRIYRVVIINLITNPVMNIILLFLTLTASDGRYYWPVLAGLELLVCGVEFLFYALKYKERKKWVLLIFTIVANALSAAAGILPVWLLLR